MTSDIKKILDRYKDRLDIALYRIQDIYGVSADEALKLIK